MLNRMQAKRSLRQLKSLFERPRRGRISVRPVSSASPKPFPQGVSCDRKLRSACMRLSVVGQLRCQFYGTPQAFIQRRHAAKQVARHPTHGPNSTSCCHEPLCSPYFDTHGKELRSCQHPRACSTRRTVKELLRSSTMHNRMQAKRSLRQLKSLFGRPRRGRTTPQLSRLMSIVSRKAKKIYIQSFDFLILVFIFVIVKN